MFAITSVLFFDANSAFARCGGDDDGADGADCSAGALLTDDDPCVDNDKEGLALTAAAAAVVDVDTTAPGRLQDKDVGLWCG